MVQRSHLVFLIITSLACTAMHATDRHVTTMDKSINIHTRQLTMPIRQYKRKKLEFDEPPINLVLFAKMPPINQQTSLTDSSQNQETKEFFKAYTDYKIMKNDFRKRTLKLINATEPQCLNSVLKDHYCNYFSVFDELPESKFNKDSIQKKPFIVDKWPHHNNFKEAVGAYFFFPEELEDLYDSTTSIYGRIYVHYALAYSAYYKNPHAYYHLSKLLESYNLQGQDVEKGHPLFSILELQNYFRNQSIQFAKTDPQVGIDCSFKFSLALLRNHLKSDFDPLEYKNLFEEAYRLNDPRAAYWYALTQPKEERQKIYGASASHCTKSLLALARLAENREDIYQAYLEAGNKGNPEGYYEAGNMILNKGYKPKTENENHFGEGLEHLKKAGNGGMLTAYDTAARFCLQKKEIDKAKQHYKNKAKQGDLKGYYSIAGILKEEGNIKEAKKSYLNAGELIGYFSAVDLEDDLLEKNILEKKAELFYFEHFQKIRKIVLGEI